jgi:hypothetical protein
MTRPVPARTWLGGLLIVISQAATFARLEPFHTWNTPICWTGYILAVDGLVWKRRGSSWLSDARAELLFLALVSVSLWIVFEMYNKYAIHNWHYLGLPESLPARYFGYAWSFATIWPAIFETGDLVSSLRDRRAPADRAKPLVPHQPRALAWLSVLAGAAMLVLPILYPSQYLAAPVFLGFVFLLDPLNARSGAESLLGDMRLGHYNRLINLSIAGLVCGFAWEAWNYWAVTKWVYTVPILPDIRLFEMPVPGYAGFPAFALECFVMYVTVRSLVWSAASRPISI